MGGKDDLWVGSGSREKACLSCGPVQMLLSCVENRCHQLPLQTEETHHYLWVFPSPTQVYLLTDIWRLSPALQASGLIPKQVLLLLPWASLQRAYSLISRCPGSMAWPPVPLLYGPLSCWGLYLVARNPTHLYLPALPARSVALASITYLLAFSPSDKRPVLAPLG